MHLSLLPQRARHLPIRLVIVLLDLDVHEPVVVLGPDLDEVKPAGFGLRVEDVEVDALGLLANLHPAFSERGYEFFNVFGIDFDDADVRYALMSRKGLGHDGIRRGERQREMALKRENRADRKIAEDSSIQVAAKEISYRYILEQCTG